MARRESAVFWRGSTTGWSCSIDDAACDSRDGCARLTRQSRQRRRRPWLILGSRVCRSATFEQEFQSSHVGAAPELEWVRHKGILEVDGNVDAWGMAGA